MYGDKEPALLRGEADGELHLARRVCVFTSSADSREIVIIRTFTAFTSRIFTGKAHMVNVFLCLMSRWEGTHLGKTLSSPSASLRHTAS